MESFIGAASIRPTHKEEMIHYFLNITFFLHLKCKMLIESSEFIWVELNMPLSMRNNRQQDNINQY
jgi:hypothetical protein